MNKLIRNENMKIFSRTRTWILLALLVVLTVLLSTVLYNSSKAMYSSEEDWRIEVQRNVDDNREQPDIEMDGIKEIQEREVKIGEYRLAHNIPPADGSVWAGVMNIAPFMIMIVGVFTVIIAADIVAGEFTTGTIKLLLIRPATRARILLSKYLATLLFSVLLLILLLLSSYLVNGLLSGFEGSNLPYLYIGDNGTVQERSMLLHTLGMYGLNCISMIMIVTMAFMISTVFRSSALAIALSLIFYLAGDLLIFFFSKYSWMKYYLFNNTNLTVYMDGIPPYEGMTLGFSITVLLGYFIIFNVLSWTVFMKRDVAA